MFFDFSSFVAAYSNEPLTCLSDDEGVAAVGVEVDVGNDGEDPLVAAGTNAPVALWLRRRNNIG